MGILDSELEFHLKIKKGDIGRYVILPGDPDRVEEIAKYLTDAKKVAQNREYNIYTGFIDNIPVSVCSTGIGGPSTAIAVEELIHCGADTFIRIGTTGGMAKQVESGDLCIANAAIRAEGTSYEYLPSGYPAVSDFEVTSALVNAAQELSDNKKGNSYHIGVVHSKDSFYGQTMPDTMPTKNTLKDRWDGYIKAGCLSSEMECSALFSVALTRGVRAGAVLAAIWNMEKSYSGESDNQCLSTDRAIRCAVEAVRILIKADNN